MNKISIKGACLNNLKGFDIEIPKNQITVVTGVSGSGKSTLMFDIVFEEGRKEYLQSIGMVPDVEDEKKFSDISGIGPTVAVKQSVVKQSNPRSTVGTRSKILGMIGLLYSSEGMIKCQECGNLVKLGAVCDKCGCGSETFEPGYFSYLNTNGMCLKCSGRGSYYNVNMEMLMDNNINITPREIFRKIDTTPGILKVIENHIKKNMDVPFAELSDDIKEEVINGHYSNNKSGNRSFCVSRILQGKLKKGEYLGNLYSVVNCSECHGYRIGEEARNVFINGRHIGEIGKMSLEEAREFFVEAKDKCNFSQVGNNLTDNIIKKINSLIASRLGHLSLYREMSTLSGGELQRLFLNSHIESKLDSLIYILDEPSVGLHESEKEELLKSLKVLRDIGNTVIVVEHDQKVIDIADNIIDIGPKAGVEGGRLLYTGDKPGLLKCEYSLTGQYLSGKKKMPERKKCPFTPNGRCITVKNAKTNTLKNVTVSFPLGMIVGVAGVSGCGKSSLVSNTLVPMLKKYFNHKPEKTDRYEVVDETEMDVLEVEADAEGIEGIEYIHDFAEVSQAPIGRNFNSNPMTFINIWDKVRKVFADQSRAEVMHLTAGDFSFNSDGACPECGGSGRTPLFPGTNMKIFTVCDACKGKRFNNDSLSVKYNGKNIAEVLEMRVSEAIPFFSEYPSIVSTLKVLDRIGMGYITLGQPTTTMSGGEAQRLKLAKEIGKKRKGNTLYIFDEPTTGLSMYDVSKLITLLDELVKEGNSVIVIEHNIDLLKACDWIVELGPEGGNMGGNVIAEGTVEDLKKSSLSVTGKYL